ncbi:class I SAM-dependent methyltransferase [Cryptosporangium sp. NPDC048952]|uniref:class I SAM-dependent methyltransferase n=1 Tax=Cryptosporangium sp. NPDC048952 TaxID=3363961 RepID=UPI0037245260
MLTVDFDRLRVGRRTRFIDVGAGGGRHSFEALRRGAEVIAFDLDEIELKSVADMFAAMEEVGEVPPGGSGRVQPGNVLEMPYDDGHFDVVLASEILEHVPEDDAAIAELVRILAPGGTLAVTVPRWLPERICWALSDEYHANEGGHIRIYRADELEQKLVNAGLVATHRHHAHALHSPYWWLKCAVGSSKDDHPAVQAYHKLLVWDLMSKPAVTQVAEQVLNPLIGKSVALYFRKPTAFQKPVAA